MRVVFRTDASLTIGAGHLVRCLALAGALRSRGADVEFVCREMTGGLIDVLVAEGYRVHRLPPGMSSPENDGPSRATGLGFSVDEDADATRLAILAGDHPAWLIVDHYALDARWESALRGVVGRIAVIDDLADRQHDCDLLIDQNLGAEDKGYEKLVGGGCRLLLGPTFALLRPEFAASRRKQLKRDGALRRLLVSFGAGDASGVTLKALEAIARLAYDNLATEVVVGRHNPHLPEIQRRIAQIPGARLHVQTQHMAELMSDADLMLGAAGSTTWERCCLGLPGLTVCTAKNQEHPALRMAAGGFSLHLGWFEEVPVEAIESALRTLSASPWLLSFLGENCHHLVDGEGASRVADRMQTRVVVLRRATCGDCERIFEWRNAPEVRKHAFDSRPLTMAAHRHWFEKTIDAHNRILLIGECDGQAVGVIRYDLSGDQAVVSVYLVPGQYGRGYGTSLIREGSIWLREHVDTVSQIVAEVKADNAESSRAFEASGFERHAYVYLKELEDAPNH